MHHLQKEGPHEKVSDRYHSESRSTRRFYRGTAGSAALRTRPRLGSDSSEAKKLIDQAEATLKNFMNDPDIQSFRKNLQVAAGVYIVPSLRRVPSSSASKAATVSCLRVKKPVHGANRYFMEPRRQFWSPGRTQSQEAILLIMTPKGMDRLLSSTVSWRRWICWIAPRAGELRGRRGLRDFHAKGLYAECPSMERHPDKG